MQVKQTARLVLLDHSLVPLDHHRVRYILWVHTLMKVNQRANLAPEGHTALYPDQHRAPVVQGDITR
jgi:hypothetical protein